NLIIDVLMSFFDRFNERGWEPEIQMPENDVIINADKSAVTRIIENLISNAINHSDGNISISLQEGASTVRLEVMNDAYRLTEHDVDHFFDRLDRFNERGWEPEIQMPENDVIINADKSAVTRIIENLISNAINHSDGNISISLQEGASTVRLEVMNDAYRLTEHDVDHFFDRFYKADPS